MWYTFEPKADPDWKPSLGGAFDISLDPIKMPQLAAGALLFLRADVSPARTTVERKYTLEQVRESLRLPSGERPFTLHASRRGRDTGMFDLKKHPHRRYNPLTREWVLVSPHRTQRPWQGQVEQPAVEQRPAYDPTCYLCPGNERAGGQRNPPYENTFVFTNDYAALLPNTPAGSFERAGAATGASPLLRAVSERGTCRVVCFSPRHDLTLAEMDMAGIARVVDVWVAQYEELGALPQTGYVQIFENRGAMMGASNPHPHGQIWATEHVPTNLAREQEAQAEYYQANGRTLLSDYLALELEERARLVVANDHFVALVPFWAIWPFETIVIGRRPTEALSDLTAEERVGLADILKRLTTRYNGLFQVSFPYSMGFHQRPTDGRAHPEWQLHAHFYPPLLRSAIVRKFMVGFELLAEPQRDITPESAAERLRSLTTEGEG